MTSHPRRSVLLVSRLAMLLVVVSVFAFVCGCSKDESAKGGSGPAREADGGSGASSLSASDVPSVPDDPSAPRLEEEAAPGWDLTPVEVSLGSARPTEYGGAAADAQAVLVVYRVEVDGKAECPTTGLPTCHPWRGALMKRGAGSTEAAPDVAGISDVSQVSIAESDTPSGIKVSAVIALGGGAFAVIWRAGRYAEDAPRLVASFVQLGQAEAVAVDLLTDAGEGVRGAAAAALLDGRVLVCWAAKREPAAPDQDDSPAILCRAVSAAGPDGPATVMGDGAGAHRAPALAWRGEGGVLGWVRSGELELVRLDGDLRPVGGVSNLGGSLARPALLAAGHGGYLAFWQDDVGHGYARRLERDAGEGPKQRLTDLGLDFAAPSGMGTAPEGFVIANTSERRTRLSLVAPDGRSMTELTKPSETRRLLASSSGFLDLARHDEGVVTWIDAAALLRPAQAPEAPDAAP